MNKQVAKALEFCGLGVAVIGIVVWYSTPSNVIVGPILIVLAGLALSGIGWLIGKKVDAASTNTLADRIRAEREQQDSSRPEA